MTPDAVVDKILDHESRISKHTEDIKTLFEQQKTIRDLANSTQDMATNVAALTEQIKSLNSRVVAFEEDKGKKSFAVWQIIVSALLGGTITYIVSTFLP